MPIRVSQSGTVTTTYAKPFVGPIHHTAQIALTLTGFTNKEIDSRGYLKPGVPVTRAGTLIGTGGKVFGVTIEPIKVAADNATATIAAIPVTTVAVATSGQLNKAIIEDNLDRALNADELAAFVDGATNLVLLHQP